MPKVDTFESTSIRRLFLFEQFPTKMFKTGTENEEKPKAPVIKTGAIKTAYDLQYDITALKIVVDIMSDQSCFEIAGVADGAFISGNVQVLW